MKEAYAMYEIVVTADEMKRAFLEHLRMTGVDEDTVSALGSAMECGPLVRVAFESDEMPASA